MNNIRIGCFVAVLSFHVWSSVAVAAKMAGDLPSIEVPAVARKLVLDGEGGDAMWAAATHIELGGLINAPTENLMQRTRVSLLHDGENIYIAFDCEDRDVKASRLADDDQTFRDDCVEIFLGAPIERLSDAVCIEINALGTVADYYYRHADWINYRYKSGAEVAVSRRPVWPTAGSDGYRVEVSIPLRSLRPLLDMYASESKTVAGDGSEFIRANFARWDRSDHSTGRDVFSIWSDPMFNFPHPHRPERYGWLSLEP